MPTAPKSIFFSAYPKPLAAYLARRDCRCQKVTLGGNDSDKDSTEVSWYKPHLDLSLSLIKRAGVSKKGHIIDIGAGASNLVDDLIQAGYENITALDISLKALKTAQARLRDKAQRVIWIEADITKVVLHPNQFDLWHDRASFHFLSSREDRQRYVELAERALKNGGHISNTSCTAASRSIKFFNTLTNLSVR